MWDQTEICQGDQLPAFVGVILDDLGNPVILDPALDQVSITLVGQRTGDVHRVAGQIAITIDGAVTYDWQDTTVFAVDTYDVTVSVVRGDAKLAAPTRRTSVVVVRPYRFGSRDDIVWDDNDAVWVDPELLIWN